MFGADANVLLGDEAEWRETDWDEVAELVTISYLVQAPKRLADQVSMTEYL